MNVPRIDVIGVGGRVALADLFNNTGRNSRVVAGLLAFLASVIPFLARGELAACDGAGRVVALRCDGDFVPVITDVRVFLPGWTGGAGLGPWSVEDVSFTGAAGRREWTGRIVVDHEKFLRYRQTVVETADQVELEISLTAESDLDLQEIQFILQLPIAGYTGLPCELRAGATNVVAHGDMPVSLPDNPRFLSARADRVTAGSADRARVELTFDALRPITVQDERRWKGACYGIFTPIAEGPLTRGATVKLKAGLRITGRADHSPAELSVNVLDARYQLDGFGGNFVYGIDSPVVAYNLDRLRVAWGRVELSANEWEPVNDDGSPTNTNWKALEANDRPGSDLHREFQLAQDLARRGIPCCISVWHLPEWLYADPGRNPEAHRRRIAPGQWPEVLECLGSYLLYVKRRYGFEPELFSFNEANEGVCVLLSAEEHRDAIKLIGAHFRRLGLKTKMLLADVADFQHAISYVLPTTRDPAAMLYIGALAFHSWGGGTASDYGAWGDLAERLGLPLLVTELGVDSAAYRAPSYIQTPYYAIQELRMYQEILLHARPRATLQWELSDDYPAVLADRQPSGEWDLTPTLRFWFLKHFYNLTPARARVLTTRSAHPGVLFTAFAGEDGGRPVHTLHIANPGAGRPATVTGLPDGIEQLQAVLTTETEYYRVLKPIPVRSGQVDLVLEPQSLLTLTTEPPPRE